MVTLEGSFARLFRCVLSCAMLVSVALFHPVAEGRKKGFLSFTAFSRLSEQQDHSVCVCVCVCVCVILCLGPPLIYLSSPLLFPPLLSSPLLSSCLLSLISFSLHLLPDLESVVTTHQMGDMRGEIW